MQKIFPPEIINFSVESHFHRFSRFSILIYIFTILFVLGAGISLFIVRTDISVQSAGIIRSLSEPIDVTAPLVAEVVRTDIAENSFVKKGDTLVWLNSKKLEERIQYLHSIIKQNSNFQNDLQNLCEGNFSTALETKLFKSVLANYQQKLEENNLEINLAERSFNRTKLLFEKEVLPATEFEKQKFQLEKAIVKTERILSNKANGNGGN